MRFAVLKGIQGFGDRLQCLLQAIRYAINTERILVVDWRDTDWTHDPENFAFDDFFQLHGVPTFGLNEFIQYYEAHKHTLTVAPSTWQHKLTDWKYQNWIYQTIFSHPVEEGHEVANQVISEILEWKRPDFDADIVVLPGVFRRLCHYVDVRHIQLSRWAEAQVKQMLADHPSFRRFQYDAIHLRGGSKSWAGGHVPLQNLADQIASTWPDEDTYFDRIHAAYTGLVTTMDPLPLLVVSDSKQLADRWQERFGECLTVPTFNHKLEESGTHKLSASALEEEAISKADLNLELIRDFVLLANSRSITWDGISLFSKAAVGCKKSGSSMLWLPES
jgi:hypothetical protein